MKYPIINKKHPHSFVKNTPSYNSGVRRQEPTGTFQPRNPVRGKVNNNLPLSFEQYTGLAQAALDQGDRILAETYYQCAEHALRLMNEVKENRSTPVADVIKHSSQSNLSKTRAFEVPPEKELTKV